ncbi:MAG: GGDEF domain-containing protein, partial [Desulfobacteraceae bacterium]|nr:GGDEF domain-containing protein [Desulfobacteraceae bacterium]
MTPSETDNLTRFTDVTSLIPFFQPMVHIHTGHLFGVEAGFHDDRQSGLEKKTDQLDPAGEKRIQHQVDLYLQQKVFTEFFRFKQKNPFILVLQLDHRVCRSQDYLPGRALELLTQQGYAPADVCFALPIHCDGEKDCLLFDLSDKY